MKTLYVVYDNGDRPFSESEDLKVVYDQARECAENFWYPVYIDKFERDEKLFPLEWYCQYNDLRFVDKKWEWHWIDCLDEFGVQWETLIRAETEHELNLFDNICSKCKIVFNS